MNLRTKVSSIGAKLPLVMSALVAMTVTIMTFLAYTATRDGIVYEAEAKLESYARLQMRQLNTLLDSIDRDLRLNAAHPLTHEALAAFTVAFERIQNPEKTLQKAYIEDNPHPTGEKDKLYTSDLGELYDKFHENYHPVFHRLQQEMGYYDVFLFDTEGNLIYSVFKELDYATNMMTGEWRESGLANVFRGAMNAAPDQDAYFEDFDPYGPSHGAAAAFIARPVFSPSGERAGVLAFQMPIDEFNAVLNELADLGNSGDSFLVGSDNLMRTDSRRTEANDVLQTPVETVAAQMGLAGEEGMSEYSDYLGNQVLGYASPIDFLGTRWALVVKEDTAELFASLQSALKTEIINGVLMFMIAVVITYAFSRSITRPLHLLSDAVNDIRRNNFDTDVPATARRDEIGGIAKSVDAFRVGLKEAAVRAKDAAFKSAAFETSGAPMLLVDTELKITQINRAAIRMLKRRAVDLELEAKGADPENMIGLGMDVLHTLPERGRRSIANREDLPFKMKLAVGEAYIGLFIDQVLGDDGEHVGFILEWKDQTLEMANKTIMQAIDAQQCRIEARLAGDIKDANESFAKMIGTDLSEVRGSEISSLVSEAEGGDPWRAARQGDSTHGLFHVSAASGRRIIEGSVSPIPNHEDKPNGFLFMGVDVTEARQKMDAFEEQRAHMEQQQQHVVESLSVGLQGLSNGDLTTQIEETFAPEYETLRNNFNTAMSELREAVAGVISNSERIDDQSGAISGAVTSLSTRTEKQAATLEETAAAIEQLTGAVTSAAEGAKEAAQVAKEARGKAEESGDVVNEAVTAMNAIEDSSNEISKIIGVIDDIAFQTNLLALNAGVEAARAGEAGRGFAVVASEVRALAQRSLEAANEISGLITASGDQVKTGVARVGDAGDALRRIVSSVAEIAKFVDDIAVSAAEQSNGLGEINQAMVQLDAATQENAAMVEETTASTQALASEASILTKTTSRFETGQERKVSPSHAQPGRHSVAARAVGATALKAEAADEPDQDGWAEF